jgi:hypothetical protein
MQSYPRLSEDERPDRQSAAELTPHGAEGVVGSASKIALWQEPLPLEASIDRSPNRTSRRVGEQAPGTRRMLILRSSWK